VALVALAGCAGPGASLTAATATQLAADRTMGVARGATPKAAASAGFGDLRVSFEHSLICDNGILIAQYAKTYGITTIYVPVTGDDIISLQNGNATTLKNLQAMTSVASVYFVTGDDTWLASPTQVPADATALAAIAKANPAVAGVLYAVDPELAPNWNSGQRQSIVSQYFTLLATLQRAPGASSFKQSLFLSHPDFGTILYAGAPQPPATMLKALQAEPGYGGTVMIVAGNSESTQYANLAVALPHLTAPFIVEASTSPYGAPTYYGRSSSYVTSNLTQLAQAVAAKNAQFAGIDVNGWNDLYNGIQTIFPEPPVFTGALPTGPLVPPAGTTYLGGFVNPLGTGQTPAQTAAFESQIGRTLAYNMHFYGFTQKFPGPSERDDVAHGRVPLIAWNCGDNDARVAAGDDDAKLVLTAKAIKAFGSPIFLRWFWEMNLDDTNNAPRTQCYDPATDLPGGYFSPLQYVRAWNHIHAVFAAQGVTNVVWLWCVANAHGGPSQYYPGDTTVDWVGMDDYDTNDVSLPSTLYIQAEELSQFQEKPFMITETGAHASVQPAFLTGAENVLQTDYPWARAVGYLDSVGSFQNWVLTPGGLSAFSTFARTPYMSAMPFAATR
jgi:hypothetical protein